MACPQTMSIRIGQAWTLLHFLRSRRREFAITRSLRMIAVMASFLHFPEATNWSYFAFMSGLKHVATTAGRYKHRLISARPPRICSRPCHFPDWRDIRCPAGHCAAMAREGGARPASEAACLPESVPSSGICVSISQAVSVAIPGMLVRVFALSDRVHPEQSRLRWQHRPARDLVRPVSAVGGTVL